MTFELARQRLDEAATFLFVPGDRPDRFGSAWTSGADAVILDLEASVHPGSKLLARKEVAEWLSAATEGPLAIVRINRPSSADFDLDRQALAGQAGVTLMVAGAEPGAALSGLLEGSRGVAPIVLLIESARGIDQASTLAGLPGVSRLAFGNMDYETEMGLAAGRWGMVYPASKLAVASRSAGLCAPIAGVTSDIRNRETLVADIEFERSLGFGGKMCIHPTQVEGAQMAYRVSAEEVAWAQRILAATAKSHAVAVDGQMIDRPVIERAQRTLSRAKVERKSRC